MVTLSPGFITALLIACGLVNSEVFNCSTTGQDISLETDSVVRDKFSMKQPYTPPTLVISSVCHSLCNYRKLFVTKLPAIISLPPFYRFFEIDNNQRIIDYSLDA